MKKICVCGHFGGSHEFFDGQTVKTKNLYVALLHEGYKIIKIDTFNPKKRLFNILFKAIFVSLVCKDIIILPAHNGIKIFVPLFVFISKFLGTRIHYVVIGGWLPELLNENEKLKKYVKKTKCIYVETNEMKKALEAIGVVNTQIMPNFKDIKAIDKKDVKSFTTPPYKLCMFSRIMEQKGIGEAVEIINKINKDGTIYKLDIYGPVENDYKAEFEKLIDRNSENVSYKGIVKPEKSVNTIKDYFLLLFPTKFATEGHPGTILDAYNAGVPVLASEWNSCFDIVDKDETGLTFKLGDFEKMEEILINISKNPDTVNIMRENCLKKADDLKPEKIIKILSDKLGEQYA